MTPPQKTAAGTDEQQVPPPPPQPRLFDTRGIPMITDRIPIIAGNIRSGLSRWDASVVLGVVLTVTLLVPARLVVKPLGAAGSPGSLLALALLLWWVNMNISRGVPAIGEHIWARIVITLFGLSVLISYMMATTRPIDGVELRAADRGLLHVGAWAGLMLITAEGLSSRERLDRVLRLFVRLAAVMAGIGMLQFFSGVDITEWVVIPGLSSNTDMPSLLTRGSFFRPAGTATHPIEFGVIMAMALPLALHYAVHSPSTKRRKWLPVTLIGVAAVMSLSRSAVLGTVVAGVLLLPTWPRQRRRRVLMAGLAGLVVLRFTVHGLLGTIMSLFTQIGSDTSAASRSDSYSAVLPMIEERPIFGRGFATFLPSYHILDNQFLGTLIEMGIVGLLILLALLLSGSLAAWIAARRTTDPLTRELAYSIAAAAVVATSSYATFDAFSFSMVAALTFFMVGCGLAIYRIVQHDHAGAADRRPAD